MATTKPEPCNPPDDPRLANPPAVVLDKLLAALTLYYDLEYWTPEALAKIAGLCQEAAKVARGMR